jgi:teichuronic acid biosynthesis glycosyltransferase TuaH
MKVLFAESHNLDRPDPVGSHQYIKLFREAGHDCLWLGPAISPMHILKADNLNRYRFQVWRKGVQVKSGISWLVPLTLLFYYNLPFLRSLYAGRNQYRFCLPPLKRQLEKAGLGTIDLLWCAGPVAYSLLDLVPHRVSCYRLADRLDKFSGIPKNVGELQKELIKRVDFVLVTSRSLWEWACSVREDGVYYLPNGVSEIFFERELPRPVDFPQDGRPVAIYVGTLDTRFDLENLQYAVKRMKDIHFLLVGPLTCAALEPGLKGLDGEINFTRLGAKAYRDLPAYLQYSAVGLIPFHLNELTEAVNPIKYYEYLASGLPVVAPPMRELLEMNGPLHSYGDGDHFCSALQDALTAARTSGADLAEFAAKHTWRNRFDQVIELVKTVSGNSE